MDVSDVNVIAPSVERPQDVVLLVLEDAEQSLLLLMGVLVIQYQSQVAFH